MATLYKRATVSQRRVLRVVEGAIMNASHVHPIEAVSKKMARSIAKRAAGTLTAQWPDVLAARASRRSSRIAPQIDKGHPQSAQVLKRAGRGRRQPVLSSAPLRDAWKLVAHEVGVSDRSGDDSRRDALIQVCRIISAVGIMDQFPPTCIKPVGGSDG